MLSRRGGLWRPGMAGIHRSRVVKSGPYARCAKCIFNEHLQRRDFWPTCRLSITVNSKFAIRVEGSAKEGPEGVAKLALYLAVLGQKWRWRGNGPSNLV